MCFSDYEIMGDAAERKVMMSSDKKIELGGWMLFVLSALFYMVSNINNGQPLSMAGSTAFLLACLVFIALRLHQRD